MEKRDRVEEEGKRGDIFRESKKTPRSPVKGKEEKIKGLMREWKKYMRVVFEEIRGLKGIKEKINKFRGVS